MSLPLNYGHLQQAPVPSLGERRRLFAFWGCAVTWSSSDSHLARSCTGLCRGFLSLCVCLVAGGRVPLFIDLLLITLERIQVGRGLQRHLPSLLAGASACGMRQGHCIQGSCEPEAVSPGSPASRSQSHGATAAFPSLSEASRVLTDCARGFRISPFVTETWALSPLPTPPVGHRSSPFGCLERPN